MSTTTRVNVVQNNVRRCIFSIVDKCNTTGDLTIALRSGVPERESGQLLVHGNPDTTTVELTRISIHRSPQSANDVNTIKLTRQFSNRPTQTLVNHTTAIKRGNRFEFVFAWRCSILGGHTWKSKSASRQIDIPNFPEAFTLCLAVFVGPPNRAFSHLRRASDDFDWRQIQFSNFSLIIVWSYLGGSAHESARQTFLGSAPGVSLQGGNESESIQRFKTFREVMRQEYITTLSNLTDKGFAFGQEILPMMLQSRFFKFPSMDTPQYRRWIRDVYPTLLRINIPRKTT